MRDNYGTININKGRPRNNPHETRFFSSSVYRRRECGDRFSTYEVQAEVLEEILNENRQ